MKLFKKMSIFVVLCFMCVLIMGTEGCDTQEDRDRRIVNDQQSHYRINQPLPFYDFSRELDIYQQIYDARNMNAVTYSVWRSNTGMIEGDCPSIGMPIPYDVQLTNPIKRGSNTSVTIEQAEPNGLYSSKNTAATWVPCACKGGLIPVYVESKVTTYPFPVTVDYETNRVIPVPNMKPSIIIKSREGSIGILPVKDKTPPVIQ